MQNFHPLVLIVFSIFFCVVLVQIIRNIKKRVNTLKEGIRVEGVIVSLTNPKTEILSRYPVVRFTTPEGRQLTLTAKEKTSITEIQQGQKVIVCYPASSPEQFVIVSGLDHLFD
jgi:general stress protein 26